MFHYVNLKTNYGKSIGEGETRLTVDYIMIILTASDSSRPRDIYQLIQGTVLIRHALARRVAVCKREPNVHKGKSQINQFDPLV